MGSITPPASQPLATRRNLRELFRREFSGKSWNKSCRTISTLSSHSSHDEKSSRKCHRTVSFADSVECEEKDTDGIVCLVQSDEAYAEPLSEEERTLYFYTVRFSCNEGN